MERPPQNRMNTSDYRTSLLERIAGIRQQLQDPTLSNMERDRLYQVWDRTAEDLDDLDHPIIEIPMVDDRVWLGEDDDRRTPTPPPESPLRFAPSPPPVILGQDVPLPPFPPVPRTVSSHGWPPPPLSTTHLQGLNWSDHLDSLENAASSPSTPRPWEPSEEDIERANNAVDDREGCAYCPGCAYCRGEDGYGYDEADEF